MTDDLTPHEQAARAIGNFDQVLHDPNRTVDPVGALFAGLAAASAQMAADKRAARTRWRNRPEAKARRSAAAKKAAATRAAKKAAERAEWAREAERDALMPTLHCPHMDITPFGETECSLAPGHPDEDHEDIDGHTWPYECDDDCGETCGF